MNKILAVAACQLCGKTADLVIYEVAPAGHASNDIAVCPDCLSQLANAQPDSRYWRFLAEAMWSDVPAIQVVAWRLLTRLYYEDWAAGCLDLLYLEEDTIAWAKAGVRTDDKESEELHRDSLGQELQPGDSVVLTRSLDVKGSTMSAKMGTVVKHIRLVADNTDQIEGKIDGQTIIILTKYLRKQKN